MLSEIKWIINRVGNEKELKIKCGKVYPGQIQMLLVTANLKDSQNVGYSMKELLASVIMLHDDPGS